MIDLERDDVIVYAHPNGHDYVALIGEQWRRWPAVEDGWLSRSGCPASLVDSCDELDTFHGSLALRLSGVR